VKVVDGEELRQIRPGLGLTQQAFAEHLGITGNRVARWERNEVRITGPMGRVVRLVSPSLKSRAR
jgi:DNA-binding transcriptional regulator YiaG